jgi:hypothetical protein
LLAVNTAAAFLPMLCAVRLDIEQKLKREYFSAWDSARLHQQFFD